MQDISSRSDIDKFMAKFYEAVLNDPLLKPKFDHIDLEEHLPRIADFWESVLFAVPCYSGSPFEKHESLELEVEHFDAWLGHFHQQLDALFAGEVSERAKARANSVAMIFKSKLSLSTKN